jgi:hypothetical protein
MSSGPGDIQRAVRLGEEEVETNGRGQSAGDPSETDTRRGGGHYQQHQHECGVGVRDEVTNQ